MTQASTTAPPTPLRTDAPAPLDGARDETWRLLQSTIHYARIVQMNLEIADDVGALYSLRQSREYFLRAIETFRPLRHSIADRILQSEVAA